MVNAPRTSLNQPNIKVNTTAPKFAKKLTKPNSVASEAGDAACDARWNMAPKLIEANHAARSARINTGTGVGIEKRPRKMTPSTKKKIKPNGKTYLKNPEIFSERE